MKRILAALFFGVFSIFIFNNLQIADASLREISREKNTKQTVLVELFTSEYCPTCPPAEALLKQLENEQSNADAEIITLALHVNYWDAPAYKDKFASPIFTRRQEIYSQKFNINGTYTPQMIVDGEKYFVGSDLQKASRAIKESVKNEKADVEISVETDEKYKQEKLQAKITNLPAHENSTVFLAFAEDKPKIELNNSVKNVAKVSIVRNLQGLGILNANQNEFQAETFLQIQPDWKKENLKLVVFVQENKSRKIIGSNRILLAE